MKQMLVWSSVDGKVAVKERPVYQRTPSGKLAKDANGKRIKTGEVELEPLYGSASDVSASSVANKAAGLVTLLQKAGSEDAAACIAENAALLAEVNGHMDLLRSQAEIGKGVHIRDNFAAKVATRTVTVVKLKQAQ